MPEATPNQWAMLMATLAELAAQHEGLKRTLINRGVISDEAYRSETAKARRKGEPGVPQGLAILEYLDRLKQQ